MNFFDLFVIIALVIFYILFIGRTIILAVKDKINPFVLGKGKSGFNRFIEFLFFGGLIIWTFAVVVQTVRCNIPGFLQGMFALWFKNDLLHWLGVILITGGIAIFALSLYSFGRSWRVGIDKENPGSLVTTGVFSISRNPIFLFVDLFFAGIALIYPNTFFILSAIVVIAGIHYQILQEEKFLLSRYGEEYEKYKSSVRRYL